MRVLKTQSVCEWQGVKPQRPSAGSKLGIALGTLAKGQINGLRHKEENGTNGWYIWCGTEMSTASDFFSPLHIEHLRDYLPQVEEYLDLPPGFRFLIDGDSYEDAWYDSNLLSL